MNAFETAVAPATDEDLTAWESRMPDLAKKARAPSGSSAYDGKRQLAKAFLAKQLIKRSVDLSVIADPGQLKDAAVFKELELMFRDLSQAPDDVAGKKAIYYAGLFDNELELVVLKSTTPTETIRPSITSLSRA